MKINEYARKFIGTVEGSANHKKIVDGYNSIKPLPRGYKIKTSDSWCRAFMSYCAKQCKVKKFPFECSVFYMFENAKKMKMNAIYPAVGDLVIYDWKNNGSLDHVGVIDKIEGNTLYVIEGNYSNSVKTRKIHKSSKDIHAYIHVSYVDTVDNSVDKDLSSVVNKVIDGVYGNGEERKNKLKSLGYTASEIKEIQRLVNEKLA